MDEHKSEQWGSKDKSDRKVTVKFGGREVPKDATLKFSPVKIRVDGIEIKAPLDIQESQN